MIQRSHNLVVRMKDKVCFIYLMCIANLTPHEQLGEIKMGFNINLLAICLCPARLVYDIMRPSVRCRPFVCVFSHRLKCIFQVIDHVSVIIVAKLYKTYYKFSLCCDLFFIFF